MFGYVILRGVIHATRSTDPPASGVLTITYLAHMRPMHKEGWTSRSNDGSSAYASLHTCWVRISEKVARQSWIDRYNFSL